MSEKLSIALRTNAYVYFILVGLIGAFFLLALSLPFSPQKGTTSVAPIRDIQIVILVWFFLTYIAYLRISFDRWCNAYELLGIGIWYKEISSVIDTHYRPLVRILNNFDEVSLAARDLIVDSNSSAIFLNSSIIFLGAAANQSDKSRKDSLLISEDSERTPAQVYQGAVEEIMSNFVPVFRVISLLTEDEFTSRSLAKKRQYLSWLRNQISQLRRNKNYVLLNNSRAPKWGASGAAIFTSSGYLQFSSVGGRALFIKDEWLSRHLVASVMIELGSAKQENKSAYTQMDKEEFFLYSESQKLGGNISAEVLNGHLNKLTNLIS